MRFEAQCSCGQLQASCEGPPIRVSICHCEACQRRTGSVFGVQARWPDHAVTTRGEAKEWTRIGDAGSRITFRFCPTCAATVTFTVDEMPGFTAVPAGAFANRELPAPVLSFYEARMHPWVTLPDSITDHID
ncbi:MAG: GFA family protein [Sandaracinaceae bacterium]